MASNEHASLAMRSAQQPGLTQALRSPRAPWIVAWSLHPELSDWLEAGLRSVWMDLRFERSAQPQALLHWRVDLWLLERLPDPPPRAPTLWLSGPERRARLSRLTPLLWQLPAPILRDTLVEAVGVVLASTGSSGR